MYQKIDQKIWVAGVYKNSSFQPTKFKWQDRELKITKVTLHSDFKDGQVKKRCYSVISGQEVYRLEFNRENETWYLREIWVD
ncbi:hypothetical protein KJ654_00455 [Patescibacteria group bacterium]|nr:hypothetical protein [Patescibacteria group bacterium]